MFVTRYLSKFILTLSVYQESTDNRESIGYAISITNATLTDDLVCSSLVNRGGQEIVVINDDEQDPETVDRKCYVDSLAKDLAPLSPEERLKYLLKSKYVDGSYNKFIAFSIDKFQISFGDYSRFLNERWITDEVVNAYFYLLEEKFGSPSICFGYSYWYTHNMQPENADACQLQRILSKKVKDDLSILFLPVNINNNHWMLAVINFMLHDIDLYDSLDGENDDVSRVLMKWFPALYGNPPYWKVWNHYNDNTIQRQQDLHNCAFFTCWYASQLAMMESKPNSDASIMQWTDNWAGKLKSIRDDVMSSLLNRFVNNWSMLAH
jgi:Ulp1 family protease